MISQFLQSIEPTICSSDDSVFLWGQPRPHPNGVGPHRPPNFRDLQHVRTQYEKRQPNFAR